MSNRSNFNLNNNTLNHTTEDKGFSNSLITNAKTEKSTKARVCDRGNIQSNTNILNTSVTQRSLTYQDSNNNIVCSNFTDLKALFQGQNNEDSLNATHSAAFFSIAVKIVTFFESHKNVNIEELATYIDNVIPVLESCNPKTLVLISEDTICLLDHAAQRKNCTKTQELAIETLCHVFQEIKKRTQLQDWDSQDLSNLANRATTLLKYAQKNDLKDKTTLAIEFLCLIFLEVTKKRNLQDWASYHLSDLMNNAAILFAYAQNENCPGTQELAVEVLCQVFQKVKMSNQLQHWGANNLSDLANNATTLFAYPQNEHSTATQYLAIEVVCQVLKEVKHRMPRWSDHFSMHTYLSDLAIIMNNTAKLLVYPNHNYYIAQALTIELFQLVFNKIKNSDHLQAGKNILHASKNITLLNLANSAATLLEYSQNNNLTDKTTLAVGALRQIFQEIKTRELLQNFEPQHFSNLKNALAKTRYWNDTNHQLSEIIDLIKQKLPEMPESAATSPQIEIKASESPEKSSIEIIKSWTLRMSPILLYILLVFRLNSFRNENPNNSST